MFCPNCGKEAPDGMKFCSACGAKIAAPQAFDPEPEPIPEPEPVPEPVRPVQPTPPPVYVNNPQPTQQPIVIQQAPITKESLPAKFRPLSAWAYFGYSILFAIPIVGFIFLIIFSFSSANINRRSYARSYWCGLILILIIVGIILLIAAMTGGVAALFDRFR